MKKIIALALSLIMVLSLSVSAFAAEVEAAGGTDQSDVKATYAEGSTAADTYSVVIAWENMAFTYTAGQKTWMTSRLTEVASAVISVTSRLWSIVALWCRTLRVTSSLIRV